jgi:hypothetical protein
MSTLIRGDIASMKTYLFQEVRSRRVLREGKEYHLGTTPRMAQTLLVALVTLGDLEAPTTRADLANRVGLTEEGVLEAQGALGGRGALEGQEVQEVLECKARRFQLVVSSLMAHKFPLSKQN